MNTLITSTVNNGVSSFFNVGEQIMSDYFRKKEAAQAEMPGATVQNEDGTIGTVDPFATQEQIMDARLKGGKNSLEFATVMMSFLSEGKDGRAFEDIDDAPDATPEERMDNLEERMDIMEEHLPDLTKRHKFEYDPYVPADSSEPSTEEARMDNIERRYTYILKKLKAARAVMQSNA
ncbi:type III secretion effector protein [Pseudomonas synxantha]|uniref:type III secretion effector protein n=2 Tax=Pseudomonas synxantha TaxID=47883 RepID=UPI000F55DA0A